MESYRVTKEEKLYGIILVGLMLLYFWIDSPIIG